MIDFNVNRDWSRHSEPDTVKEDDEHLRRAFNARQARPKPVCTNCLQYVDWSRIDGAWFKFNPGSTTLHTCVAGKDVRR
jgi:hypothetical protein